MITNPPFMPQKGQPAYHLRDSTPEELEQHRRMVNKMEQLRNCSASSRCDTLIAPLEAETRNTTLEP